MISTGNIREQLFSIPTCKEPKYASKPLYGALVKNLGLKIRWVKSLPHWVNLDGSPGDALHDFGTTFLTKSMKEYNYLHEICHAFVAQIRRPKKWIWYPNFGCYTDTEEVDTSCLQFYIMAVAGEKCGTKGMSEVMSEYSFDILPICPTLKAGERLAKKAGVDELLVSHILGNEWR